MVGDVVRLLTFDGPGWIVDGTVGPGGHASALLDAIPQAMLLGMDRDPETVAIARENLKRFGSRALVVHGDYAEIAQIMKDHGISAAKAILLDLGWSSEQISRPQRGFSFAHPGPLDMRFDQSSGIPLSQWLEDVDTGELTRVIREYGEERWASAIARHIKERIAGAQHAAPLRDTAELAETIASAVPRKAWPRRIHPATRTFQALRIAVNHELERLDSFLDGGWRLLEVGGRIAIIAFHSLEDRRIKQRFTQLAAACLCPPQLPVCLCGNLSQLRLLTRGAIKSSESEIMRNPRARSARLRAAERIR